MISSARLRMELAARTQSIWEVRFNSRSPPPQPSSALWSYPAAPVPVHSDRQGKPTVYRTEAGCYNIRGGTLSNSFGVFDPIRLFSVSLLFRIFCWKFSKKQPLYNFTLRKTIQRFFICPWRSFIQTIVLPMPAAMFLFFLLFRIWYSLNFVLRRTTYTSSICSSKLALWAYWYQPLWENPKV